MRDAVYQGIFWLHGSFGQRNLTAAVQALFLMLDETSDDIKTFQLDGFLNVE